jgi:predicted glycosyltransferase
MKKLMFYCQHILGMGHLVRSMEIVRGLIDDFQVCFINGGQPVEEFDIPNAVHVVNLPAIKTDAEFRELQVVDSSQTLEEVQNYRVKELLNLFDRLHPDVLMIELFPFGRRRFSFELLPLLDQARASQQTKVVCSLRDIVVTKQDQARHEEKICKLMNRYFDALLIHGDPTFQPLEDSFSRVQDLTCQTHYTGYVVQSEPHDLVRSPLDSEALDSDQPMILVSVGGGRFGHDLLECVIETASLLEASLPHHFYMFTGPFMPDEKLHELQQKAMGHPNLTIRRYTSHLISYMEKADLSISMAGYNTTMNILTTGVRSMILPFTGNDDQEQITRAKKLEQLGVVEVINSDELQPDRFAQNVIECLKKEQTRINFDVQGVQSTARLVQQLVQQPVVMI